MKTDSIYTLVLATDIHYSNGCIKTCSSSHTGNLKHELNTWYSTPEAEFLDEIQTKVLRLFLLAIHSHLYSFAMIFLFLQTHATSYSFYSSFTVHCKG
jgi:hypothetical protein